MKQEIKNLENIELMKAIYKEIIETKDVINKKNEEKIDKLTDKVNFLATNVHDLTIAVNDIKTAIKEIKITLIEHGVKFKKSDTRFEKIETKLEEHDEEFKNLNKVLIGISKMSNLNDYDKIILRNLESRITILEEETQKYEVN